MMRTLVVAGLPLVLLGLLGGCASLSEGECRHSDWYDIGFRDGRQGAPPDRVSRHAEACGEHGVAPDRARYREGHEAGLQHYCTRHSGFTAGESGAAYHNVCPAAEEGAFLEGYTLGQALHRVRGRLSAIDYDIGHLDERIASEETDKKELPGLIYRRVQLEGERGEAREELRRLESEADTI